MESRLRDNDKISHLLLSDFPRGVPGTTPDAFRPPAAQFAHPVSILESSALKHVPGKLFLGVVGAEIESQRRSNGSLERYAVGGSAVGVSDDRHVITVAGSRAGKGRAVIVPNMLSYTGSIVATDPKGELATLTASHRKEKLGQDVHVLDPFQVVEGPAADFRASFNPLSILQVKSRTLIEDAGLIADALIIKSGHEEHWDESARDLITGLILRIVTSREPERRNLIELRYVLRSDIRLNAELLIMAKSPLVKGVMAGLAESFMNKPDNERGSVLSNARRHTAFLDFTSMSDVLTDHDFDLEELKSGRVTLYLCLPAMRMGTCNRWLRLFINLTLAAMEVSGHERPDTPVLLCLDEFATLGHMKTVEDAAGQIAGFGVKLWPIIQDLGQLETLYEKRWQTFMANAGVLQFFGNSDLTTLEWISKRLGRTAIRSLQQSEVGYQQQREAGIEGRSWSTEVHDLLTVDEIAQFFGRDDSQLRQLVIWAGRDPLVLQRAFYDKHERFRGLANDQATNS